MLAHANKTNILFPIPEKILSSELCFMNAVLNELTSVSLYNPLKVNIAQTRSSGYIQSNILKEEMET